MPRCPWATAEPAIDYHDQEWGVPVHDERVLFEFLILEGAQAGLSWITILKKRENYQKAFDGFRAEKIACYGAHEVTRLLGDPGIVRNRLKIAATIQNAKAFLAVRKELGSFESYLWSGKSLINTYLDRKDVSTINVISLGSNLEGKENRILLELLPWLGYMRPTLVCLGVRGRSNSIPTVLFARKPLRGFPGRPHYR